MAELHHVQRPATRVPRYVAPTTVDEAIVLKAEHGAAARAVAGGTDLVVELDRGGHADVELLIDVSRIAGANEIVTDDESIRLGAATTHHDVMANGTCRTDALALAQACLEIGSPQLRNRATVVGNVVTASPANDTISALTALGASIEITSVRGSRNTSITDFITGFRTTSLADDELVTGITIPRPGAAQRTIFVKSGLRRAQAISVVHVALVVRFDTDGNGVTDATIALGSVAPTIVTVPGVTSALREGLSREAIRAAGDLATAAASPIDDLRATADYRSSQVAVMVERGLTAIADGTEAARWPTRQPFLRAAGREERSSSGNLLGPDTPITVEVNGHPVNAPGAVGTTLLDWLRDRAACSGVKEGCAEGECGACTVHLDGDAVMGCLVPAARADGCSVTTVEGLATDGSLAPIQRAFVEHNAVQCGFCTPGFLMSCASLLDELSEPTLAEVRAALAGNLCRCTGYRAIEAAFADASRVEVGR